MNIYGILNMEMRKLKWGRDVCGVSGGRWSGFLYDTHNDTPTSLSGPRASPKKSTLLWSVPTFFSVGNLTTEYLSVECWAKFLPFFGRLIFRAHYLRRTGGYGRRRADGWLNVHFLAF